jgi:hypothetical protein
MLTICYAGKIAHMTWFHAAELFEDLARMGLTTASAIERAYRKDKKLLWRLVSCFARAQYLAANMWGKLTHVVSWSEHFRPYFKRWRVSFTSPLSMLYILRDSMTDGRWLGQD